MTQPFGMRVTLRLFLTKMINKMNYLLNFLSILVFFINRFFFRKSITAPSFSFWLADNWPELSMTLLLNLICMLLMGTNEATIALESLPAWIAWIYIFGKPGLSVAIGLGLSWAAYGLVNSKLNNLDKETK